MYLVKQLKVQIHRQSIQLAGMNNAPGSVICKMSRTLPYNVNGQANMFCTQKDTSHCGFSISCDHIR